MRPRKWKPNESFFLQAVGDQLVLSVNSYAPALSGSLARRGGRKNGTAQPRRLYRLSPLRIESGAFAGHAAFADRVASRPRRANFLRQHGDAAVDQHYIEQLARALVAAVRQTDIAVKYTAWSLVFILPDTSLENAQALAEKLASDCCPRFVRPWGRRGDHQRRGRGSHLASRRRHRRSRHRMDQPRRSRPRRSPPAAATLSSPSQLLDRR